MVYVTRRFEFSASHRYWRDNWNREQNECVLETCTSLYGHGHNYTLEVTVSGEVDGATGMVIDLVELDQMVLWCTGYTGPQTPGS